MSEILRAETSHNHKATYRWLGGLMAATAAFGLAGLEAYDAVRNNGPAQKGCTITVESGETLWSIAEEVGPDVAKTTGEIKSDILAVNPDLSSSLDVGDRVAIPQSFCASLGGHPGFTEIS